MFNGHLSLSHPPPVHRSEEMGLRNPLIWYRMNLDCFFYCHWSRSDLARLSAVDQIDNFIASIKQRKIQHTLCVKQPHTNEYH